MTKMATGKQQELSSAQLRLPEESLEQLIADIVGAMRGLEYGAVTVSVKGGKVVQLERNEKRRLPNTASQTN